MKETGRDNDMDALQTALEGVWRAHIPKFEVNKLVSDSSCGDESASEDDSKDESDHADDKSNKNKITVV